jgi:hypothetical protein
LGKPCLFQVLSVKKTEPGRKEKGKGKRKKKKEKSFKE